MKFWLPCQSFYLIIQQWKNFERCQLSTKTNCKEGKVTVDQKKSAKSYPRLIAENQTLPSIVHAKYDTFTVLHHRSLISDIVKEVQH